MKPLTLRPSTVFQLAEGLLASARLWLRGRYDAEFIRLLARGDVDPELLLALAERLSLSGRGASAARARIAAQVAGITLPRGEDLDGEQLVLEVSA